MDDTDTVAGIEAARDDCRGEYGLSKGRYEVLAGVGRSDFCFAEDRIGQVRRIGRRNSSKTSNFKIQEKRGMGPMGRMAGMAEGRRREG